jgi:RHH-type proline utilization regulon transcriptional repressor/proline dehydrogenase/delta 1-pyrroline-5-carboxylate dehydrogenase
VQFNEGVRTNLGTTSITREARAVEVVERLLAASAGHETRQDRRRQARLSRMLDDPSGSSFTVLLTDQVARIRDRPRAARRLAALVDEHEPPASFGSLNRLALRAGARLAPRLPDVVMPLVVARMRKETTGVILPAEDPDLARHIARRQAEGVHLNVNILGEAVLGEGEAQQRLRNVIAALDRPDVDYVSVKISSICSQINSLAFDPSVDRVAVRLRDLYRAAARHQPAKFVNLDMEEYRDLALTVAVFKKVLSEPEFAGLDAGIVLQAYLPDSYDVLVDLCRWARGRRGATKIRIVKGANLAMEQVEAELRDWPQAPYDSKAQVDANYKRLVETALDPQWGDAVRVGVASHNLFDVAWALLLADELGTTGRMEIEMLEGMANAQAAAVRDLAGGLLLYAPVVARRDFESAIAYLVRRLDENTGPENFLRSLFSLQPGNPAFIEQRDRFLAAVAARRQVSTAPRRTQDRNAPVVPSDPDGPFVNTPDTDFALAANREWIERHLAAVALPRSPLVAGPPPTVDRIEAVDQAMAVARAGGAAWRARSGSERRAILTRVADVIEAHRGETLAVMAQEAGKTVLEGDPEVSEASDFARYYAQSIGTIEKLTGEGLEFEPLGTVVVASPWNFPYAIPAGGVLAALAAGNAVILKPAPEAVRTGWHLAQLCWEAGVPGDVLQFLPCADNEVGQRLITHEHTDGVILTGSYDTARLFLGWRPELRLHAETSGKNAIVITAAADIDLAIKDLVRSAFGHAGQKCSAASLAIVEASVYDDGDFRRRLADAATSLTVGPAADLSTDMGPLIAPPSGPLRHALERLQPGEEWLVEPSRRNGDDRQWSPGIKLGVRAGSTFHLTECFGPVLGVMRAESLDEAIALQNQTAFGLTGGLHSLDPEEIARWRERVEVGNAYINRSTTGAIVQRQPFGGWKRSVVGPTFKAGGPNYVLSLGQWRSTGPAGRAAAAAVALGDVWAAEFAGEHDPTGLRAESNVLRYRPLADGVVMRVGGGVADDDVDLALRAARVTGTPVTVSLAADESDEAFAARLAGGGGGGAVGGGASAARLRLLGEADPVVLRAAHEAGMVVDDNAVVAHGRIELLRWVREQAISQTRHRHGRLDD